LNFFTDEVAGYPSGFPRLAYDSTGLFGKVRPMRPNHESSATIAEEQRYCATAERMPCAPMSWPAARRRAMKSLVKKRSVMIVGHKTSVTLRGCILEVAEEDRARKRHELVRSHLRDRVREPTRQSVVGHSFIRARLLSPPNFCRASSAAAATWICSPVAWQAMKRRTGPALLNARFSGMVITAALMVLVVNALLHGRSRVPLGSRWRP
jgi:hypothetical protein